MYNKLILFVFSLFVIGGENSNAENVVNLDANLNPQEEICQQNNGMCVLSQGVSHEVAQHKAVKKLEDALDAFQRLKLVSKQIGGYEGLVKTLVTRVQPNEELANSLAETGNYEQAASLKLVIAKVYLALAKGSSDPEERYQYLNKFLASLQEAGSLFKTVGKEICSHDPAACDTVQKELLDLRPELEAKKENVEALFANLGRKLKAEKEKLEALLALIGV